MADKIEEVKKDIAELEKLQTEAIRQKVKDILSIEIRRLVSEVVKLEEMLKDSCVISNGGPNKAPVSTGSKCYEVKLNNYAWDQTQKFVKFYVTLPKVHTLPAENVSCKFTSNSLEMEAKGLENRNYIFTIKNLLSSIDPSQSSWKIKTDTVLIMAAKVQEQRWSHVTSIEKKVSDAKTIVPEEPSENAAPGDELMKIMKKMYENSDDEMKRTIMKAWAEGQQKSQT